MSLPGMLPGYEVQPVEDEQVGTVFDAQQCFSVCRINMDLHQLREGIPIPGSNFLGSDYFLPVSYVPNGFHLPHGYCPRVLSQRTGSSWAQGMQQICPSRTRNLPSLVLSPQKLHRKEG